MHIAVKSKMPAFESKQRIAFVVEMQQIQNPRRMLEPVARGENAAAKIAAGANLNEQGSAAAEAHLHDVGSRVALLQVAVGVRRAVAPVPDALALALVGRMVAVRAHPDLRQGCEKT